MLAVPYPVPPPLAITEAEAVTFMRTAARLSGGTAVRLYRGGFKSPPERLRRTIGYAAVMMMMPEPWNDRPTWVYDKATRLLRWCEPNALRGVSPWVSWRGIDAPGAP